VKFKRQRASEVDLNITPLIDVVFLLLIFFMVSTTFTKEAHLNITLPKAAGEPAQTDDRLVDITITERGEYAVNGKSLVNGQLITLKRAIRKASRNDNKRPLTITADALAPHQAVVAAMDAAGQLGFVNLSITTKRQQTASGESSSDNGDH
jgi:biopolymer transport protein ExbD